MVTSSQVTFYDDGFGADGLPVERLLGGAIGTGLFQKIKDGYTAAGVHSDIGGGYLETGLSDIALTWILGRATDNGIETVASAAAKYTNIDPKHSLDQIHESWNVLWAFPERRTVPDNAVISNSVPSGSPEKLTITRRIYMWTTPATAGYRTEPVVAATKVFTAGGA